MSVEKPTEMPEKISESNEGGIEAFRAEMREIQRKEKAEEVTSGHLENFDADDLIEDDFDMWERFQDHTLSLEEFNQYRDRIPREEVSRRSFMGLLGNKFGARRSMEEAAAWKKSKGKK